MGKLKLTPFDVADYIRTPSQRAEYFNATIDERDDAAALARALHDMARAQGLSKVARRAGLSRASFDKALLRDRGRDFQTIVKIVGALGLKLTAEAVKA